MANAPVLYSCGFGSAILQLIGSILLALGGTAIIVIHVALGYSISFEKATFPIGIFLLAAGALGAISSLFFLATSSCYKSKSGAKSAVAPCTIISWLILLVGAACVAALFVYFAISQKEVKYLAGIAGPLAFVVLYSIIPCIVCLAACCCKAKESQSAHETTEYHRVESN